eukprot:gb/GEZN01012563.1/.p1 GENE.gb/GEZN01012563.1/~~gb/GEZN01012563.1/.p1  ORF type:complete len:344 (+),score=76.15 gb/GEZN01012563.1/:20-1051(+)
MPGKIGTHDGTFHADEALAVYMLRLTKEYKGAQVLRSRDPKVLDELPIIVDVGSVYAPEKGRFDHHQRGFTETFSAQHKTKLSSAGLIYKHFGLGVLSDMSGLSGPDLQVLYEHCYTQFIEGIDGIDNGVVQCPGVAPLYAVKTDLSSRVGYLNPSWNEEADDADRLVRFEQAVALAGKEFIDAVLRQAKSWLPARTIVKEALAARLKTHASGQVMELKQYTEWQEHLFNLEVSEGVTNPILYCIYQDTSKKYRIQAVAERYGSFVSRAALPEQWRGLRNQELDKVTGVAGGVFVHAGGFIGGHETREGVLGLAAKSLELWTAADSSSGQAAKKARVDTQSTG